MMTLYRAKFYSMADIAEHVGITEPTLERFMCNIDPCPCAIYVNSAWHFPEKETRRILVEVEQDAKLLNLDAKAAYEKRYGAYKPNVPAFEHGKYMTLEGLANELAIDMTSLEDFLNAVKRPYPRGYFLGGQWRFELAEAERLKPILFKAIMKANEHAANIRETA